MKRSYRTLLVTIACAVALAVVIVASCAVYRYVMVSRVAKEVYGDAYKMAYCMTIGIGDSIYVGCYSYPAEGYESNAAYNADEFTCRTTIVTHRGSCDGNYTDKGRKYYVFKPLKPGTFDITVTQTHHGEVEESQRYAVTVRE